MAKPPHLPNIVGCLIGFAVAGCGVGSLVGTAVGHHLYPLSIYSQGSMDDRWLAMYGGTQLGMEVGATIGAAAGGRNAFLVRRSRLRRLALNAEPGPAANTGPLQAFGECMERGMQNSTLDEPGSRAFSEFIIRRFSTSPPPNTFTGQNYQPTMARLFFIASYRAPTRSSCNQKPNTSQLLFTIPT